MKRPVLLMLAIAHLAVAQGDSRWFDYLGQVRTYLKITPTQFESILSTNADHQAWLMEELIRTDQVNRELVEERSKTALDPMALGLRYVEIEAICRQMAEKTAELRRSNADVLTDSQREKLKTLEAAIALVPVIREAQQANLVGDPSIFVGATRLNALPFTSTSDRFNRTDGVRLGTIGSGACGPSIVQAVISLAAANGRR